MIEINALKRIILGFALGGGAGFLFHKNLKTSKGLGVALGGLLGVIVAFEITKNIKNSDSQKEKERKILEGLKKWKDCKKEYNIGQPIDMSKMTKEELILATKKNEENALKYGALCNSYMVKEN